MESELEQTEATLTEDADPLDRLDAFLTAQDAPDQPQEKSEGTAETTVDTEDGGDSNATEPQVTTSDLAKYLGVEESVLDLDEDGTIKLKTKVDGQEGAAKLAELLKSYQLEGHVNKRSMELSEREKAFQARAQEAEVQAKARLEQVEQLANVAASELLREYQSIDWNALRQADAGQYAALKADFQERSQKLQAVMATAQQQKAQSESQLEQQRLAALEKERERLPALIPEWKDSSVAEKEAQELWDWGLKIGYTPDVLKRLHQSTALDVATFRKAMLYDKLQQSKPDVENKVRQAPKLVKPGQAAQDGESKKLENLRTAVKKSGGKDDAVAALLIARGIA